MPQRNAQKKSARTHYTKEQKEILMQQFRKDPRPSREWRKDVAKRFGLEVQKIDDWFINCRKRTKEGSTENPPKWLFQKKQKRERSESTLEQDTPGNVTNSIGNEENRVENSENAISNDGNARGNAENAIGNDEHATGDEENPVENAEHAVEYEENDKENDHYIGDFHLDLMKYAIESLSDELFNLALKKELYECLT